MSHLRKIPATMVTQHPDHAHTPYWHYQPFISTQEEPYECYLSFSDLGATEYKWDWEGKLVDEAVLERLMSTYYDYFKMEQIGRDRFITYRLPNPKVQTEYRMGRAFMGILAASGLANGLGVHGHPLFEVILPMTETAQEMIDIQEAFAEIAAVRHPLLKRSREDISHIELIPLFEDIDTIRRSPQILAEYIDMHMHSFKKKPSYMRPYIARSDPALNAGLVPTVLAIKEALSGYRVFEEHYEIPLFPIIGAAALPFRGGLTPHTVGEFIKEYSGIRTTTIQSSFRYDYDKNDVIEALQKLESELPLHKSQIIPEDDKKKLLEISHIFSDYYRKTIEEIAPLINAISAHVPKRRERVQHTGLFGYSRGVGGVKLPRAITFTAALYSLGIPPELIGTGRGIRELKKQKSLDHLEKYFINIRSNLLSALRYVDYELLSELSIKYEVLKGVKEDVDEIEKYLNNSSIGKNDNEREHKNITSEIYQRFIQGKDIISLIEKAAFLRKSIG